MSSRYRVLDLLRRPVRRRRAAAAAYTATFQDVFARLTAAECVALCDSYGLLSSVPTVGTGDGELPSELSAEGALSWMMWNEGRGEWYTTSTPASISSGTMRLWLDAKDQSTLFSDAGVTPITNGGAVYQWNDKSGGNRHFSQSTEANRPAWNSSGYVAFGAADSLASGIATSNFLSTGDNTIFLVATVTNDSSGQQFFGNGGFDYINTNGSGGFKGRLYNGTVGESDNSISGKLANTKYIFMLRRYGGTTTSNVALSVNGETESPTASDGVITGLGANLILGNTTGALNFRLHEFIIHNAELNTTARNDIGLYLASKHNTLWLPKINDYRYRGNLFAENRRANEVRDYLEARFNESSSAFMSALGVSGERSAALRGQSPPGAPAPGARAPTKILFWDSYSDSATNALDKLLNDATHGPTADARSNLIRTDPAYWGQGGVAPDAYSITTVKNYLDAQPAGRRALAMGGFKPLWAIPITSGAANGRFQLYDRQADTAKRCGASLESWWTWANNTANGLLKFLTDLKAAGAALDYLVTDVEQWNRLWQLQWGTVSDLNTSGRVALSAVDTGTDTLTSNAHGFANGDIVAFFTTGTLPAPLVKTTWYYVRDAAANTFKVAATAGGAAVNLTSAGAGTNYALRESWAQVVNDPNWTANHGTLTSGVRGMITPVMEQEVWKAIPQMTPNVNEIAFNYDAHADHYFSKYFSNLLAQCKTIYPALNISDYEMGTACPGTIYTVQSAGECQYGAGHTASGVSAPPMYGDWYGERWEWGALANVGFSGTAGENQWAAFSTQIMRLRSSLAANNAPSLQPWLSHELYTAYQMMGSAGLWAELILHASLLSSGVVNYYQPTGTFGAISDAAIAAEERRFIDLIEEMDDVLANPSLPEAGQPIATYKEAFLVSRAWAGSRFVSRVTPNPNATSQSATEDAAGVTFSNSLGALTITRGTIHASSQSALAPIGYWVEQGVS
jgi:hypothetical protein